MGIQGRAGRDHEKESWSDDESWLFMLNLLLNICDFEPGISPLLPSRCAGVGAGRSCLFPRFCHEVGNETECKPQSSHLCNGLALQGFVEDQMNKSFQSVIYGWKMNV